MIRRQSIGKVRRGFGIFDGSCQSLLQNQYTKEELAGIAAAGVAVVVLPIPVLTKSILICFISRNTIFS
jgi:hypothetical protein